MIRFKEEYLRTRDIDWFIKNGEYHIHATSIRGDLPDIINDREYIMAMYKKVYDLHEIYQPEEIAINLDFIKRTIFKDLQGIELYTAIRNYLPWFVNMARKGFISFDRTNIEDFKDNEYHIVAFPIDITSQNLSSLSDFSIKQTEKDNILYDYIISHKNNISENHETLLGEFYKCKICHCDNKSTLNLISIFQQQNQSINMKGLKGNINKKNVDKQIVFAKKDY